MSIITVEFLSISFEEKTSKEEALILILIHINVQRQIFKSYFFIFLIFLFVSFIHKHMYMHLISAFKFVVDLVRVVSNLSCRHTYTSYSLFASLLVMVCGPLFTLSDARVGLSSPGRTGICTV